MQQMKEQLDTGYQRLRREHLEGVEEQRKASLSQEELEEEPPAPATSASIWRPKKNASAGTSSCASR